MSDIQVISGTRRAIKEMADGTIRVQVDIDPSCRAAFWALFPSIDMPVALAPLVADFERRDTTAKGNNTAKGGALARLAAQLCDDPSFWHFIEEQFDQCILDANQCADWMREQCGIASRAELDSNADAAEYFHTYIRKPWLAYQQKGAK